MSKQEIEKRLGFEITDEQHSKGVIWAQQKLQRIIRRYGDADGVRRTPEYLAELVTEAIADEVLSEFTLGVASAIWDDSMQPSQHLL